MKGNRIESRFLSTSETFIYFEAEKVLSDLRMIYFREQSGISKIVLIFLVDDWLPLN